MELYGISDLHLSTWQPKPMDIFGPGWTDHEQRIMTQWRETVGPDDIVLVPGDVSWAMKLAEAKADLDKIAALPGRKVLGKGNHCYWWGTNKKVREAVDPSIVVLDNETVVMPFRGGRLAVTGIRGWIPPSDIKFEESDEKIWNKELNRLKNLLGQLPEADWHVLSIHFPPFDNQGKPSEMIPLIREAGIKTVVYGHLHGSGLECAIIGPKWGLNFYCVSADYLEFKPKLIEVGGGR